MALALVAFVIAFVWKVKEPAASADQQPLTAAEDSATTEAPFPAPSQAGNAEIALPQLPTPPPGALKHSAVLYFEPGELDAAAEALEALGIRIVGRIDALGALRIRYDAHARQRLAVEYGPDLPLGFDYAMRVPHTEPTPADAFVALPGTAFGSTYLEAIGAAGLSAHAGQGVTVAIIDTGLGGQSSLGHLDTTAYGPEARSDHGTLVTRLAGELAPGARYLSYNVFGEAETTDSFKVAEAMIAATEAGAEIINLSLGSYGDSATLAAAAAYAHEQGVSLVAATGNDGTNTPQYPAAYPGVIAIGAIDAHEDRSGISNFGEWVDLTAPGVGLLSTDDNGRSTLSTGTSLAAPLVAGAIASVQSAYDISSQEATTILLATANDSGRPGPDDELGLGVPDLSRALNYTQPGIYDAAIADHHLADPTQPGAVLITVQNRGTEPLADLYVRWATGDMAHAQQVFLGSLGVGQSTSLRVNLPASHLDETFLGCRVFLSNPQADAKPDNDLRVTSFRSPE